MIGGQVGIVGHITIANGSKIAAQSGVGKSILEENKTWFGSPVMEHRKSLKTHVIYRNLSDLEQRITDLERKLKK